MDTQAPSPSAPPADAPSPASAPSSPQPNPTPAPTASRVTAPVLLEQAEPVYPEAQQSSGRNASVGLLLTIDATGAVVDVAISTSAGDDFDKAALALVPRLRFAAATKDGAAVKARIPFRVDFKSEQPAQSTPPQTASANAAPKPNPTPAPQVAAVEFEETLATDDGLDVDVQGKRPELEPTRRELSGKEITRIPGTNGDALASIGNMPGVARTPGLDGGLVVRGSAPEDTKIFAEGIEIPMAYHFDGISSVMPSEVLERIDFYPGNFGPQYGRAMGGVVALEVRSPRKDRLGGLLQFDLLDGRIVAETPINDSTRVLVAARRSWVDAWLGPLLRQGGMGVALAPVYYDAQFLLEHDLSNKTRVRLFAYGAEDRLSLLNPAPSSTDPSDGGGFSARAGFWRAQVSLDTRLKEQHHWESTLSVGQDREQFNVGNISALTTDLQLAARSNLRSELSKYVTSTAGVDVEWTRYHAVWRIPVIDFGAEAGQGPLFGRPVVDIRTNPQVVRPSAYAQLEVTPVQSVTVLPGIRANYDSDTRQVTVEPRVSARYVVSPGPLRTTLKGGTGLYYQPPDPYEVIEPFGTKGVKSPHAMHYSLGVEQEIATPIELSVEGFYKDFDELVVSTPANDSEGAGTAYENIGSGRAYGAELLLRYKPVDRFFGWIAYTLSNSERRDAPDQEYVPFAVDQTHVLTALGSYKLGKGWELGARFRYTSGTPYTPYLGGVMDFDAGAYAPVLSSQVNSARGEAFHQLDVRVDKTWEFQSWRLGAYLDVQNAYNHRSSDSPTYNYDYSQTGRFPGLPFLPVLGVRGEL